MILLDTNILSGMLRRTEVPLPLLTLRYRLQWLGGARRIGIPGLVLQELLTGLRHVDQFDRIHRAVQGLPLLPTSVDQHVEAARLANRCLSRGVAVHVTDALLAVLAIEKGGAVLTEDQDFLHIAPHVGVRVLSVEDALRLTADP